MERRRLWSVSSAITTSPSGPRTAGSASSTSCAPTAVPRSPSVASKGNGVRCIYHGWKIDVSGCVVDAPTQVTHGRPSSRRTSPSSTSAVHESGGLAWVWLGGGEAPPRSRISRSPRTPPCTVSGARPGFPATGCKEWRARSTRPTSDSPPDVASPRRQAGGPRQPGHRPRTAAPSYETQSTARTACGRPRCGEDSDGQPYVRITEHLMPLVTVVPVGRSILEPAPSSPSRPPTTPTTSFSSGLTRGPPADAEPPRDRSVRRS